MAKRGEDNNYIFVTKKTFLSNNSTNRKFNNNSKGCFCIEMLEHNVKKTISKYINKKCKNFNIHNEEKYCHKCHVTCKILIVEQSKLKYRYNSFKAFVP